MLPCTNASRRRCVPSIAMLPRPLRETCEEILKIVESAIPATRMMLLL